MRSLPTPNYVTTEEIKTCTPTNLNAVITIPAGMFVRPIDPVYLPIHIKNSRSHKWFNDERDVYCYTRFGIVVIPIQSMRKL